VDYAAPAMGMSMVAVGASLQDKVRDSSLPFGACLRSSAKVGGMGWFNHHQPLRGTAEECETGQKTS